MSSLALPPLARPQAPLDPKAHWITPKEQLNRLYLIAAEIIRLSLLTFDVAQLVQQYVTSDFDKSVTNWYTALTQLNSLPVKIPPLPKDIYQILNDECPIYAGQLKADKTAYKIKDTHFLSLVPKEFGNLNRLERGVLKPYGEQTYSKKKNPLRLRSFWPDARKEHADVPFPDTHWILMTKDVLPGSRDRTWDQQVALVNWLSLETLVDYEIPNLQQSFAGITTDMVATGERCYQAGDIQNRHVHTYTRVKEMTQGDHLAVGGFTRVGLYVCSDRDIDDEVGVAALRQF